MKENKNTKCSTKKKRQDDGGPMLMMPMYPVSKYETQNSMTAMKWLLEVIDRILDMDRIVKCRLGNKISEDLK